MKHSSYSLISSSLLLFLFSFRSHAQDLPGVPVNYPGLLAGVEWNTISGMTGIEYERIVLRKSNFTAGIKGAYMFPYRTGNMELFGSDCCDESSIATALVTADYFTSKTNYIAGFYLHGGLGAGMKRYEWDVQPPVVQVRPAVEIGAGWLFLIGRRYAVKWTNTITFPSRDGGITISRLAFGF